MTEIPEDSNGEEPGSQLDEEPQAERGPEGSRDAESDPSGTNRPTGTADDDSDTGIDPEGAQHPDAPNLQSGGG